VTDTAPTTPGPMVDALQALRLLIRCVERAADDARERAWLERLR
jgi:hypothetical protein